MDSTNEGVPVVSAAKIYEPEPENDHVSHSNSLNGGGDAHEPGNIPDHNNNHHRPHFPRRHNGYYHRDFKRRPPGNGSGFVSHNGHRHHNNNVNSGYRHNNEPVTQSNVNVGHPNLVGSDMPNVPLINSIPFGLYVNNLSQNINMIHIGQVLPWTCTVDKLNEFRFDMLNTVSFIKHDHSASIFNVSGEDVTIVIESVLHYFSQPVCVFINGSWTLSEMPMPIAQHICVGMDNGIKRYEEVLRLNSSKYISTPDQFGHSIALTSAGYRIRVGNPKRRPRFRDMLLQSLLEVVQPISEAPMELIVSRASGRAVHMDRTINKFFFESRKDQFETFVQPIIQHIMASVHFKLTAANYIVHGTYHRPVLSHATIHICNGDSQLFECVSISVSHLERRVFATAHDSAFARKTFKRGIPVGMKIFEAVSYTDFGPDHWGPALPLQNPRVPSVCNPLFNFKMNPVFNRCFNPYTSPAFLPAYLVPVSPLVNPVVASMGDHVVNGAQSPACNLNNNQENEGREKETKNNPQTTGDTDKTKAKNESEGNVEATPKLNAFAPEFYPPGYHVESEPCLPGIPLYSGPEEVYLSGMVTESEDYPEDEDDEPSSKMCSGDSQDYLGFGGAQSPNIFPPGMSDEQNLTATLNNSWSEEVEEQYASEIFVHQTVTAWNLEKSS